MNKLAIIPIFFLTMCGTAPITDDAAHANVDERDLIMLPREQLKGEIDITNPDHIQSLHMMFMRNMRKGQIEQTATKPDDAINNALDDFWEAQDGSNGSTKQEKLL
jgi:hypothetical protein